MLYSLIVIEELVTACSSGLLGANHKLIYVDLGAHIEYRGTQRPSRLMHSNNTKVTQPIMSITSARKRLNLQPRPLIIAVCPFDVLAPHSVHSECPACIWGSTVNQDQLGIGGDRDPSNGARRLSPRVSRTSTDVRKKRAI